MIRQITEEIFQYTMCGNEFENQYQPIISVGRGGVIGMESLMRASYYGEAVSPEGMFAYARKENMLYELDRCCQMHAVRNYRKLDDSLLFINMEAASLDEYLKNLQELLSELDLSGIRRDSVVIEISERISEDDQFISAITDHCRKAGLLVALDDVGAEHSNLYRIIRVGPDIIKIDRSVISGVQENHLKQEVVRAVCTMGQRIGAIVIAEGAETQDEVLMCMTCGVDWFQGYYFDKAMRPEEIGKQSYLSKCRSLSGLYRQKENVRIENASREIRHMKDRFCMFRDAFRKTAPEKTADLMQSFAESCEDLECIYLLNEEGIQLSERVFQNRTQKLSGRNISFMRKGDCHISKEYYYMVVHEKSKIYVSSVYISPGTGNLCRTVSASCHLSEQVVVICIDFIQKGKNCYLK